jgi:hypothetical protein
MQETTINLTDFLADSDWRDAFGEAMGIELDAYNTTRRNPRRVLGFTGSNEPFARSDVARIVAISDGEKDERNWIGVFALKDGRFGFVRAGCDYTGWDCQASGDAEVAASVDDLVRLAMSDEERSRLGFQTMGTSSPTDFDD